MLSPMSALQGTPAVILGLFIILFSGFLMTRLTKKLKFPNVTGYLFAGILIGPYMLHLVPDQVIGGADFVTDVALAFIAFGVGKYFRFSALRRSGWGVVVITVFEALMAALIITLTMVFVFRLPVPFSLLLGAIGCATAPASTIMTIRQYRAKGRFVDTILQVVALDDAVALIAFSACAAVAQGLGSSGTVDARSVLLPLLYNLLALAVGVGLGFALKWLISERRSQEHRLVLVTAIIIGLTGLCALVDVSPLLACMALGTTYTNAGGNKNLFKQVNKFTPPILLCFFVLSGMRLDIPSLLTSGLIGVAYFFVRIVGKYAGACLGASLVKAPAPIRKYLGLALIPQAGVSIGLAVLGQRLLPGEYGTLLSTIVLSSAVLYEMVGPACAKASLFLSHTIERPKDVQSSENSARVNLDQKTGKKKSNMKKEALCRAHQ